MTRPKSDIDPRKTHLEPKKKRNKRRVERNRPPPNESWKAEEPKLLKRALARPIAPQVIQEPDGKGGWEYTPSHSDRDLWELQLAETFGTRNFATMKVFLRDLRKFVPQVWDDDAQAWRAHENRLNAALAMISDMKPDNTLQAALAAQLVAAHILATNLSHSAFNSGGMVMEREAALASKMMRTFAMLLEQYRAMKGGKKPTRQTFIVKRETHVHYHDERGRGRAGNGGEPQATDAGAVITQECRALSGPSEINGEVVPFPGSEGAANMPRPRRNRGSAQG
jgi:hypothetical protein